VPALRRYSVRQLTDRRATAFENGEVNSPLHHQTAAIDFLYYCSSPSHTGIIFCDLPFDLLPLRLPSERPHQFRLRQNMTFHGRIDIVAVNGGT
jgi:hypothetical protein